MVEEIREAKAAWEEWKNRFNSDGQADDSAYDNFKKNHEIIQRHNQEFKEGKRSFQIGHNKFSHLDISTFSQIFKGLIQGSSSGGADPFNPPSGSAPSSIDWRDKGAVNAVQNQGQCGCCYAFSAVASIEGQYFIKNGQLAKISEQNAMDGSADYGNNGGNGGTMDNVFDYVKANGGIDSEDSYPYTGQPGPCQYDASNSVTTISGYVDLPQGDEDSLTNAVANIGPISVGIDASQSTFQLYKSGIYDDPNCSADNIDHAVVVVGYGTEDGKDYYLVRNSWGEDWGEQGYIKMARNANNFAGITNMASYPTI